MKHRHGISVKECLAIGASILFVALGCLVMWGGLYVEIDPSRACYVNDEPVDNELECKINTNVVNLSSASTRTILASMFSISGVMLLMIVVLCHNPSKKK